MGNIHPTAEVHDSAVVPESTKVWNYAQIRENVVIGENCVIGRNVYIGPGVVIGKNCKIQNNALIYEPAVLEDGVFIGPAAILTNDKNPRSVTADGTRKSFADWQQVGVTVQEGASLGAGSICVAPLVVGKWSVVAAGSVTTKDTRSFGLYVGAPARQVGWVGRAAHPLIPLGENVLVCPSTGETYSVIELGGGQHLELTSIEEQDSSD
jgi:UDP-2-acetamido-3-amino-2,3-dideoxy-glucuronate N-acetyltransferase